MKEKISQLSTQVGAAEDQRKEEAVSMKKLFTEQEKEWRKRISDLEESNASEKRAWQADMAGLLDRFEAMEGQQRARTVQAEESERQLQELKVTSAEEKRAWQAERAGLLRRLEVVEASIESAVIGVGKGNMSGRNGDRNSLNPEAAAFSPQKILCEEKHRIMVIIAEQLSAKGASKPGASSPAKAAGAAPTGQGKQKVAAKGVAGGPRQGKGEGQGSGGVINRLSQEFINKKGLEAFKALLEREAKKGSEELTEGAATTEEKKFHASWYWRRKKKRQQSERG